MREIRTQYGRTRQSFSQQIVEDGEVVNVKTDSFMIPEKKQRIITSGNAVIVFLDDGSKGVAKCMEDDYYDQTKGIKIAYLRAKIKSMNKELKDLIR